MRLISEKALMEYLMGHRCDSKNKLLLMHARHKAEDVAGTMMVLVTTSSIYINI